jgi:hypothetical protein
MKALTVTEFRRRCFSLLADLTENGVIVTKLGEPLARITPLHSHPKGTKGKCVVLPLLKGKGKPGPLCPNLETPYDLVFG